MEFSVSPSIIIGIFGTIVALVKTYEWSNKRKIQNLMNLSDKKELKKFAIATNTIGWIAGGKFKKNSDLVYKYAITSLSEYYDLQAKLPKYDAEYNNLKETAFQTYLILKNEMRMKFSKKENEESQIWAAMQMLDIINYIENKKTPPQIDDEGWAVFP